MSIPPKVTLSTRSGYLEYRFEVNFITGFYHKALASIAVGRLGHVMENHQSPYYMLDALQELKERKLVTRSLKGGVGKCIVVAYELTEEGQSVYDRLIKPNL